jgi:hypothetical protein
VKSASLCFLQALIISLLGCSLLLGQPSDQAPPPGSSTDGRGDLLRAIDQLIEQNRRLERQNQELIEQIQTLRGILATQAPAPQSPAEKTPDPSAKSKSSQQAQENPELEIGSTTQEPYKWGAYTPNLGYKVANTEHGDLSVSIYTYARYLNQLALDPQYTDAFGNVHSVQQRQDFQLQKVQIKFLGWILDPKFRYFLYAWTSNASQGLGAQVVLAGNLNYTFDKMFSVGAGIRSLPGTRSVEGNFPFWLSVDSRLMADEFFRPSYTSGVWAWGQLGDHVDYIAMIGNNLSTLGVSAAQLDNGFNTISTSLVWKPTTGEFGPGFGDFEWHEKLATRLGIHFNHSIETKQSQPNSEQFENTQLRLSDGSVIFTPNLFGPGITIDEARYQMISIDSGLKYHGFSLEGEYYLRWLNNFRGPGVASLRGLFDHGMQMQTSAMVLPKLLQIYVGGSTIFGQYGDPWDFRTGINYFPFKNKVVRWNTEFLYLYRSAVGYTSVPYPVGGSGPVFYTTWELAF